MLYFRVLLVELLEYAGTPAPLLEVSLLCCHFFFDIGEVLMASFLSTRRSDNKGVTLLEGERHIQKGSRSASILQQELSAILRSLLRKPSSRGDQRRIVFADYLKVLAWDKGFLRSLLWFFTLKRKLHYL